jgi:hypothetical protein
MGILFLRIVIIWLVISTPLKNINQLELLFRIYGKIKKVPKHQPVIAVHSKRMILFTPFFMPIGDGFRDQI